MLNFFKRNKFNKLKKKADPVYAEYLDTQHNRSINKHGNKNALEENRKKFLIDLLASKVDLSLLQKALIIGCRDSTELDLLENKGVNQVIGIDLFSFDKRVEVMDMHDMKFSENFFDLVYASHSLEHSLNSDKVFSEIIRVLKDNGILLVEVPVGYKTGGADLQDFENSQNIISIVEKKVKNSQILYQEDIAKGNNNNFCGTDASRIIIRIQK